MNAVELALPDGCPSRVWMCGRCHKLHNRSYQPVGDGQGRTYTPEERDEFGRQAAVRCCDWRCRVCGEPSRREFYALCEQHENEERQRQEQEKEAARFARAEKIPAAEFADDCMLYNAAADRWFRDLDEALDHYAPDGDGEESERPAYLWLSVPIDVEPDVCEHVGDWIGDHYHEDAADQIDKTAWRELELFVSAWWKKNRPSSWEPDFKRCVILRPVPTQTG